MGERKVMNKYFPPDFDPRFIPKRPSIRGQQIKIRFMLPCSVQCTVCGQFIYAGKKFNARKEEAVGFAYLGIRVWRFYIHCTSCSCEIALRTDPKNSDYVVEAGANRNFEPWKQDEAVKDLLEETKAEEERGNAMQALENRTLESKREMDILDALEEIRELNKKKGTLDTEDIIEEFSAKRRKLDGTEDREEEIRLEEEVETANAFAQANEGFVKRLVTTESDSGGEGTRKKPSFFSRTLLLAPEPPGNEVEGPVTLASGIFIKRRQEEAQKGQKSQKRQESKHRKSCY